MKAAHRGDFKGEYRTLLLMDGSVRFVKDGTSPTAWAGLGSRAGGEVIGADSL